MIRIDIGIFDETLLGALVGYKQNLYSVMHNNIIHSLTHARTHTQTGIIKVYGYAHRTIRDVCSLRVFHDKFLCSHTKCSHSSNSNSSSSSI